MTCWVVCAFLPELTLAVVGLLWPRLKEQRQGPGLFLLLDRVMDEALEFLHAHIGRQFIDRNKRKARS